MEAFETLKRIRRSLDGNFSNRKMLLILLVVIVFILYTAPIIFRKLSFRSTSITPTDSLSEILNYELESISHEKEQYNAHVRHFSYEYDEKPYILFTGNGYIGLQINSESQIMIKHGRTLSVPVKYRPVVSLNFEGRSMVKASVSNYVEGIIKRIEVWQASTEGSVEIVYQTYAHRTVLPLLVQDVKILNPTDEDYIVEIDQLGLKEWSGVTSRTMNLQHGDGTHEYIVFSGKISVPDTDEFVAVSIVTLKVPSSIQVPKKMSTNFRIFTSVNYSNPIRESDFKVAIANAESSAINTLKSVVTSDLKQLRLGHLKVWQDLWQSGFGISESKAENAINGDLINATFYYVLCQSRAPLHENQTSLEEKRKIAESLSYTEGCYGGPPTLQATTLWSELNSLSDVLKVVNLWLMTLEKQGCHQLLKAGADGVLQAMILSIAGFQFSNQHLELNADPSHLHRDYFFRRINYGSKTHLNVSISVQEDLKAVLHATVDRADTDYYACDAGCLDPPVKLGPKPIMFPVKRTEPATAILYITSDKYHMEDLKHTIHVHEIALAPAHQHHVIAIHKHGHKWGGLPVMFWFVIVVLIAVFHLFLFKLVINEYCAASSETRIKYRKHSDLD